MHANYTSKMFTFTSKMCYTVGAQNNGSYYIIEFKIHFQKPGSKVELRCTWLEKVLFLFTRIKMISFASFSNYSFSISIQMVIIMLRIT